MLVVLLATGCVSTQKYSTLKKQHEQTLNEKTGVEEVLNKLAVENDSLKKQNNFLDSMYRAEHEKIIALNSKNYSPAPPIKGKVSAMPKNIEYDKKALYIYNMPNYIFWPRTVKADKFLIGIVGESAMNAALAANVYGKKIHELQIGRASCRERVCQYV